MESRLSKILTALLVLFMMSLACGQQADGSTGAEDSDMSQEVATAVAATMAMTAKEESSAGEMDEKASDQTVESDEDEGVGSDPSDGQPPSTELPAGAAVAIVVDQGVTAKDGSPTVSFVNPNGQPISALKVPGIMQAEQQRMHIAGTMPPGLIMTPLVYYSLDNGGVIRQNINDNITDLANVPFLLAMVGVPGQPVIAYSTADLTGSGLHTELFVSTLQDIGSAAPILVDDGAQALAYKPLAVDVAGGETTGVWFTREPYGIGGADLIYWLHRGLYRYDVGSGQVVEYFDDTRSPSGVSPDRQLGAYSPADFSVGQPMILNVLMTASVNTVFPLGANHERGAGFAVFSADSSRVAWMECGGSMTDASLHCVLRVGDMSGTILYDSAVSSIIGGGPVYWVQPVEWLDDQTVLAQIRRYDSNQQELAGIDIISGAITEICKGKFIGLVYP